MSSNTIVKIIILILGAICLFFIIEAIIGEVVTASENNEKGSDEMFPFYLLILVVGGITLSTLSYVSWRKYKGEKSTKQKSNDKSID